MNQATSSIIATSIATISKATNVIAMTDNPTIDIKTINATIFLVVATRTLQTASPTKRIASAITSRKRATRPCIMTSPLCQAWTSCPEKGVALAQDLLCSLVPSLPLAQAAGATTTIMWLMMIASQAHSPSTGICTPLRVIMADVAICESFWLLIARHSALQEWDANDQEIRSLDN
jgi:hypothetical protein